MPRSRADIAALPSITKQQKALAEEVDEAARKYISGTLREQLLKEIAAVEELSGRNGHFTVEFGFDPYRNKDALDVLVVGYDSAFGSGDGYVQAAVRIEGGARPDPVPVEARENRPLRGRRTFQRRRPQIRWRDDGQARNATFLGKGADPARHDGNDGKTRRR